MKTQIDSHLRSLSQEALEARVTSLQHKLSDRGHRTTPQRLHILRTLLATQTHPTAEEIWDRVRIVSPTTTLATIYKTLDTLKELGEVIELETRDDSRHYDAIRPDPHPHVVCKRCGRIDDVDLDGLDDLKSQATVASGYRIEEQDVTFYGLCFQCRQPETAGA